MEMNGMEKSQFEEKHLLVKNSLNLENMNDFLNWTNSCDYTHWRRTLHIAKIS